MVKKILILFFTFNILFLQAKSEIVNNIKVSGNQRVSDEVIKIHMTDYII